MSLGRILAVISVLCAMPCVADEPSYDSLLTQLKSGFTDIDFGQLRTAYAATPTYDPYYRGGDTEKALAEAVKQNDCAGVISAANKLLNANFTNISAHVYAGACAHKLNDLSSAKYHRKVAAGLLASIAHSGDGKSAQSAYIVVTVDEEYAFLSAVGMRITGQSLIQYGSHECDAMEVVDASGLQKTVYFNVDIPWAWLAQKFPPRSGAAKDH